MKIEEIRKFPALMGDKLVTQEIRTFEFMSENLKTVETNLNSFVRAVQKDCQHEWEEERREDRNIASCFKSGGHIGYGMSVLDSKTCKLCGLHEKRPAGAPTQVCHSCWSPMEYHSTIPGQGERTMVYECKNPKCSHGSWHT